MNHAIIGNHVIDMNRINGIILRTSLYRNEFIYFICIESLDRLCLFGVATTYYILGRLSRRRNVELLCGVCVCNSSILVRGRRLSISILYYRCVCMCMVWNYKPEYLPV
jgi:hypothetical protein